MKVLFYIPVPSVEVFAFSDFLIKIAKDNSIGPKLNGDDVWVNFYKKVNLKSPFLYNYNFIITNEIGHKWPVVNRLAERIKERMSQISATHIWFWDYDVQASQKAIRNFLNNVQKKSSEVDIAQMALTRKSYYSHEFLLQKEDNGGDGFERVPFCEIMCPLLRKDIFFELIQNKILNLSESGWGLDFYWGANYSNWCDFLNAMTHRKPIESTKWKLRNGLTPLQEMNKIIQMFPEIKNQEWFNNY